jgi:BirA family transcriptional regulator, biotin operon repressor / biotin---[acetyl-CoA-carboxylase] ligase
MKISTTRLDSVSSTQDYAKRLAGEGAPEGTVVVARTQDQGRGRLVRRWLSPEGGLWFSMILRPACRPSQVAGLTLLAAVSIAEAVNAKTGVKAGIKWPNDILVGNKKLGGILTEMKTEMNVIDYVALGVGLNVNVDTVNFPHDLLMPATSLKEETGQELDIDEILDVCLENLTSDYGLFLSNFDDVMSRWKALSLVLGRRVIVAQPGRQIAGTAFDIDNDGALLVRDDEGATHIVHAGDLSILR